MKQLGTSYKSPKQVMNKFLTSHEQVPTVVITMLKTGETTIPSIWCRRVLGVWCRVVPRSCDN